MAPRTFRIVMLPVVLACLWGAWEGYRWTWATTGWTKPFPVDDITMPHIHAIVGQLFTRTSTNQLLLDYLFHHALFTAKEAIVGFLIGASIGFLLGILLAQFRVLQRGVMPYVVASQTIPILAIAPIVVVGLGSVKFYNGWTMADWEKVSVIAAYLTFFPVTVNTIRGLQSADPRALELMHSYAASRWAILWKLRIPSALPYLFAALKVAATASVVGAIIAEAPSSIQDGLGGAIISFNQYYSLEPKNLWATNLIAALLGISFFLAVVGVEKLVVRRAPEHLV
jgi:NitT/TauT family transport system permease protein